MTTREVEKIEKRLLVLENLFRDFNEKSLKVSPSFIIRANEVYAIIRELKSALSDLKQAL